MNSSQHRLHVRRCHVCHSITERVGEPVDRCDHCGKAMAPYYYFDECEVEVSSDDQLRPKDQEDCGGLRPLRGLSVCW